MAAPSTGTGVRRMRAGGAAGTPPLLRARHCVQPATLLVMKNSCNSASAYSWVRKNRTANSPQPMMPVHQVWMLFRPARMMEPALKTFAVSSSGLVISR
jgi:hypothetical protein